MIFNSIFLTFMLSLIPVVGHSSQGAPSINENINKKAFRVCKTTDTPTNILACNMYREARGESDYGMISIGFVTLNRKDNEVFPTTIKKIVYQPGQFSWTKATPSFKVHDKDDWKRAQDFASMLIFIHNTNKNFYNAIDVTKGSLYYHAKEVKPYWAKSMVRTVKIGNHVFYKNKPKA